MDYSFLCKRNLVNRLVFFSWSCFVCNVLLLNLLSETRLHWNLVVPFLHFPNSIQKPSEMRLLAVSGRNVSEHPRTSSLLSVTRRHVWVLGVWVLSICMVQNKLHLGFGLISHESCWHLRASGDESCGKSYRHFISSLVLLLLRYGGSPGWDYWSTSSESNAQEDAVWSGRARNSQV